MELYLDVILMLNFIFNWLILSLTSYLVRCKRSIYQLLIGTSIATALIPIVLYYPNSFVNTLTGKGIYSFLIIISTFGFKGILQSFKTLFLFYFVSFSIGGGLFGIHFLIRNLFETPSSNYLFYVSNIYGDRISLALIVIGFPLLWLFTKSRMDRQVIETIKYDQMYNIRLELNGRCHKTNGFIDTGNHLVDPLTNRPVIICDEMFLKQFFDRHDWFSLKSAILDNEPSFLPNSIQTQIVIVPYQGVEGSNNYLYTLKPKKLTIWINDRTIETNKVLVGIQLSHLTNDHRYHCLLHPHLIHFYSVKTA